MQTEENKDLSEFKSFKISRFNLTINEEKEFKCPELRYEDGYEILNYVDLDYCEGMCFGEGCNRRKFCEEYINQKINQTT